MTSINPRPSIEISSIPISSNDISSNIATKIIAISEDKLLRILEKDRNQTEKNLRWVTPLGIFLSLFISILTTDFKARWGILEQTWMVLFYLLAATSLCYTIYLKCTSKVKSIEQLVDDIKGEGNS